MYVNIYVCDWQCVLQCNRIPFVIHQYVAMSSTIWVNGTSTLLVCITQIVIIGIIDLCIWNSNQCGGAAVIHAPNRCYDKLLEIQIFTRQSHERAITNSPTSKEKIELMYSNMSQINTNICIKRKLISHSYIVGHHVCEWRLRKQQAAIFVAKKDVSCHREVFSR